MKTKSSKQRIAVVVIHGMGNQYPMDTLRKFIEGMRPDHGVLYSSPNRITDDMEVRRLSYNDKRIDYFEYYWAHHISEPSFNHVIIWALKLLFIRKPSRALLDKIWNVRAIVISLLLIIGLIFCTLVWLVRPYIENLLGLTVAGLIFYVVVKLIWPFIKSTIAVTITSSIGDVVKYTIPSPENIETRQRIRSDGIKLLRNLHDAKNGKDKPKYDKIVLVGHSLGSIVAYNIMTSLFEEYHGKYDPIPTTVKQIKLDEILTQSKKDPITINAYQDLQSQLFDEYRNLGNQWRISHFITLGSPLTHSSMITSKGEEDFKLKKEQRECPVSPPVLDHQDKHFAFKTKYFPPDSHPVDIKILHHAALFAETQWTNIFYKNDWIGGPLASEFGLGIKDIAVEPPAHGWLRLPLATHTRYWDKNHDDAFRYIRAILEKVSIDNFQSQKKTVPEISEKAETDKAPA